MGKLISIIGASGVGKTTLAQALARAHPFATALEQHTERPFQTLFKQNGHYALANQLDYFLLRAEQEQGLRAASQIGLMDGGLDLDFHGFTRLFLHRGLLGQPEYDLCRRLYTFIRATLPRPELFVSLKATTETVTSRMGGRKRVNIARAEDTAIFTAYMDEWLASIPSHQVLYLDVTNESAVYENSIKSILAHIKLNF